MSLAFGTLLWLLGLAAIVGINVLFTTHFGRWFTSKGYPFWATTAITTFVSIVDAWAWGWFGGSWLIINRI